MNEIFQESVSGESLTAVTRASLMVYPWDQTFSKRCFPRDSLQMKRQLIPPGDSIGTECTKKTKL